jgi:sugar transferase (PEP-CTERM system associated)
LVVRRAFLIAAETTLLGLAGLLAAYVRLSGDATWQIFHRGDWTKLMLAVVVIQLCFYLFDLYDMARLHVLGKALPALAKAFLCATVLLSVLFYAVPMLMLGRGIFLISLVFSAVIISACRILMAWYAGHPQLGIRERILVLGSGEQAIEVARATIERRSRGFHVVGFVDDKPHLVGKSLINPSVIGLTQDLEDLVQRHSVDRVVVAVEDRRGKFPIGDLLNLRLRGRVAVEEGACYYERLTGKINTDMLRPSWLIFSQGGRYSDFEHRVRRVFNIVMSSSGIVLSLPIMLIVAIAVKLDSKGPIFYLQERVGENDRIFKIIKFRSMRAAAERESGPVWASESDPRITRVGRIIRKLRLDELPQFINILRGDMSFVGPRPERPEFVEELKVVVPYYSRRHLIKPGLTGWAQIRYPYGASVEDAVEKLRYDLYYIKNKSWLLDAAIAFETIKIVLFGRGAR